MRRIIAKNPRTPLNTVELPCSTTKIPWCGWRPRGIPCLPQDLIARLAESEDEPTRYGVAGNPATPADILAALLEYRILDVACGIAINRAARRTADRLIDRIMGEPAYTYTNPV